MRTPIVATAVLLGSFVTTSAAAQDFDSAGEQQMLARINAMRAAQQLPALARHDGLDDAARGHSSDMATQGQLTHVSRTSGTPADRVRRAGVSATTVAENVALHRSTEDAHQALLGSDAHRANMLSREITHVGLAALRTERGVYLTQVFAALPQAAAPPVAAAPTPAQAAPTAPAAPAAPAPAAPPVVAASEAPVPAPAAPAPAAPAAPPATPQDGQPHDGPECFSPLPGLRICSGGRASAPPPVAQAPVPPAQVAPPAVEAPAAPGSAQAPPAGHFVVQPGSNGAVVVQHAPDGRVAGYWVRGSGRWWWYPMPEGAQPGQQLQPDLRVTQPPAGFPVQAQGVRAAPMARPRSWGVGPVPQPGLLVQPSPTAMAPGVPFYGVPPPPMAGHPSPAWRRAHAQWLRAYQRWMRQQQLLQRQAL
jgi:hypothetical protein